MWIERRIIALLLVVTLAVPWVQAIAAIIRETAGLADPSIAFALTLATASVLLVAGLPKAWSANSAVATATALALSALAILILQRLAGGFSIDMLAVPIVCPVAVWVTAKLAGRMPSHVDAILRRRPVMSISWCIVAGLALVQTSRLATHMSDPESSWWITTDNPFYSEHMCVNAYIYGAELNRRGADNVYDPSHYPGLTPDAKPQTQVANLIPEDPYQYPPPFLLLPRMAIALSNDFLTIRTVWLALHTTAFALLAIGLTTWIGGERGLAAVLMLPVCWLSIPVLSTFQYGQFHLAAVMLGVGAMLAFDTRRTITGAALLAGAILSKMFPAILLVPLIVRRRWRPVGWTAVCVVLFSLAALPVIGMEPFVNFYEYHLPRMRSGEAFSFVEAWSEYREELIALNQSPMFWTMKLDGLGISGLPSWASKAFHAIFSLLVVAMGILVGRRTGSKHQQAGTWLALLGLASISSPAAFADYISVAGLWLLTLLTFKGEKKRWQVLLLGSWIFMFFLPGIYPLPPVLPSPVIGLSIVEVLFMIALFVCVILRPDPRDQSPAALA